MKYHVHIYKVIGKIEVDIKANNGKEAKERALKRTAGSKFRQSECNRIAISFKKPFIIKQTDDDFNYREYYKINEKTK